MVVSVCRCMHTPMGVSVTLGVCVCICDCVVCDFFLFLSVMLVWLHFVRNKLVFNRQSSVSYNVQQCNSQLLQLSILYAADSVWQTTACAECDKLAMVKQCPFHIAAATQLQTAS